MTYNDKLQPAFSQHGEQQCDVYTKNLLNHFFSKICDADFKEEPPSPNSSEMYSPDVSFFLNIFVLFFL